MVKYVWFDLSTGKFSDSWTQQESYMTQEEKEMSPDDYEKNLIDLSLSGDVFKDCKLLKFECLNDEDFEFTHLMKVVTNL